MILISRWWTIKSEFYLGLIFPHCMERQFISKSGRPSVRPFVQPTATVHTVSAMNIHIWMPWIYIYITVSAMNQPVMTWVLGHLLVRLLARSNQSLFHLLRPPRFARAPCCAYSFARSLRSLSNSWCSPSVLTVFMLMFSIFTYCIFKCHKSRF